MITIENRHFCSKQDFHLELSPIGNLKSFMSGPPVVKETLVLISTIHRRLAQLRLTILTMRCRLAHMSYIVWFPPTLLTLRVFYSFLPTLSRCLSTLPRNRETCWTMRSRRAQTWGLTRRSQMRSMMMTILAISTKVGTSKSMSTWTHQILIHQSYFMLLKLSIIVSLCSIEFHSSSQIVYCPQWAT